ncbi:MAG: hypothetical protein RJA19_1419 [Bacteroidota bacterium]
MTMRKLQSWHKGLLGLLFAAAGGFAGAQPAREVAVQVLRFDGSEGPYLEVECAWSGRVFGWEDAGEGVRNRVEMRVTLERGGTVLGGAKSRIEGAVFADSLTGWESRQFHIERIPVSAGPCRVTVRLEDLSNPEAAAVEVRQELTVRAPEGVRGSDLMLVSAFARSEDDTPSLLTRSGLELLPWVDNRIPLTSPELRFYGEWYGLGDVPDSLFLLKFRIEDTQGSIVKGSERFLRKPIADIVPFFEWLPWGDLALQPGTYYLVAEAADRTGAVMAESRALLQAEREGLAVVEPGEIAAFALQFTDRDTLLRHLMDHLPTADGAEQRTIQQVLPAADLGQMQSFLDHFWRQRDPVDPTAAWAEYNNRIAYVNAQFGGCRKGMGADTDMGYVYLKYGPPHTRVQRHHDTNYYPYEIWHYHRAGKFTDRRFLFYAPHAVAECFEILHSDVIGETSNGDWLHVLRNRENKLRVSESQSNRLNPRDTYSREEPEDLFFNPR